MEVASVDLGQSVTQPKWLITNTGKHLTTWVFEVSVSGGMTTMIGMVEGSNSNPLHR